jgi:hypothetical protein
MTRIKVTQKTLMVNLEFPIEVGQVKLTAECQVFISKEDSGELDADFNLLDYNNITYMGMPVDGYKGWQKIKDFHSELGIDLQQLVHNEYDKVIDKEFQKVFLTQFEDRLFNL